MLPLRRLLSIYQHVHHVPLAAATRVMPIVATSSCTSLTFRSLSSSSSSTATSTTALKSVPRIIWVLGGPGSGKGTQCEKIFKQFGAQTAPSTHAASPSSSSSSSWLPLTANGSKGLVARIPYHLSFLSVGDLLRAELARFKQGAESPHGELIATILRTGTILPGYVTAELLKQRFIEDERAFVSASPKITVPPLYLIDGFPRTLDNVHEFEARVGAVERMIFLTCSPDSMTKRMMARGRGDDEPTIMRRRIDLYNSDTVPVSTWMTTNNRHVITIDANGTPDEVYTLMQAAFQKLL